MRDTRACASFVFLTLLLCPVALHAQFDKYAKRWASKSCADIAQDIAKRWPKYKEDERRWTMAALGEMGRKDVIAALLDQHIAPLPSALNYSLSRKQYELASYLLDVAPEIAQPPDEQTFNRMKHIADRVYLSWATDVLHPTHNYDLLQKLLSAGAAFNGLQSIDMALQLRDDRALGIILAYGRRCYREPSGSYEVTRMDVYRALDEVVAKWICSPYQRRVGVGKKGCSQDTIPKIAEMLSRSKQQIVCAERRCLGDAVIAAAMCDNVPLVKQLIELGATGTAKEFVSISTTSISGDRGSLTITSTSSAPKEVGPTALYYAIVNDNAEMVSLLVRHGADPTETVYVEVPPALLALGSAAALRSEKRVDLKFENGMIKLLDLARGRGNNAVLEALERKE